jgi:CBS domain-containing protein
MEPATPGIVSASAGVASAVCGAVLEGVRAVLRLPWSVTRLGAAGAPPGATVADVMQRTVATIAPETRLGEAWTLMQRRRIRHLPVVDPAGRLCGLLTHRDVLAALPSSLGTDTAASALVAFGWAEARDLMATRLETVRADEPACAAGRRMAGRKIGCLPVVGAQGELIGILTETDFVRWATEHMESPARSAGDG